MSALSKVILSLLLIVSCSHNKIKKERMVVQGQCENEFKEAEFSAGEKIWKDVSHSSSTGASYLVTGLAYSTDFLVSFTGGVVSSLAVCSPLILLTRVNDNNVSGQCIGEVGVAVGRAINPNLGPKATKSTETWKCPDLRPVTKSLVKVAKCYEAKGETELARTQLQQILASPAIKTCLPQESIDKITNYYDQIPVKSAP